MTSLTLLLCFVALILPTLDATESFQVPCNIRSSCGICTLDLSFLGSTPCCWNPTSSTCGDSTGNSTAGYICPKNTTQVAFNCPKNPPNSFQYTDTFGRNKVLPFIAASNGNLAQAQACLANHAADLPGVQVIKVYNESNYGGILAVNPNDNAIVVAFRGAKGVSQLLALYGDLNAGANTNFSTGGKIFAGYNTGFNAIWTTGGLGQDLKNLTKTYKNFKLWAFGHSLGGSLASLTAAYAVHTGLFWPTKVQQVTTGQTRTGNLDYAIGHDLLVPYSYRIINGGDWITKLPDKSSNLDNTASFHNHFEVWYNTAARMALNAGFVVCKQAEDPSCSNQIPFVLNLSSTYHNSYFNVAIDTWVNTGCV